MTAPLLTRKEVAARLSVTPRTIDTYCERGDIPFIRIRAGKRFDLNEVERFIKDRTFQHHPRGYGQ